MTWRGPEFSRDGKLFLTSCLDGRVLTWDVSTPQARLATILKGQGGPVRFAAFFPDGQTVVTGDDKAILLWNVANPAPLSEAPAGRATENASRSGWKVWLAAGFFALVVAVPLGVWLSVRHKRGGTASLPALPSKGRGQLECITPEAGGRLEAADESIRASL